MAILLSNKLCYKPLDVKFLSEEFESVFVTVSLRNGQTLVFLSICRPPNTNTNKFNAEYLMVLKQLTVKSRNIVIGLDHNMDFLKLHKHECTRQFIDQNLDHGLIPTMTHPIRITRSSATLINNILLSMNLVGKHTCNVLIDHMSDHLPSILLLHGITSNK